MGDDLTLDDIEPSTADVVAGLPAAKRRLDFIQRYGQRPENVTWGGSLSHFLRYEALPTAALSAIPIVGPAIARSPAGRAAVASGLAGMLMGFPSEAANEAKPTGDFQPPGLGREIWDAFKNIAGGGAEYDKPMTLDEFKQARTKFPPRDAASFIKAEQDAAKADPEYAGYGPKKRDNLMNEAERRGQKSYQAYLQSQKDEQNTLKADFDSYRAGWDKARGEYYAKSFIERNPGVGTALTYGAPIVSGLVAPAALRSINKKGFRYAESAASNLDADKFEPAARDLLKVQDWLNRAPIGKTLALGELTLLPSEMRGAMDFGDRYALPPDSKARQDAEQRMSDWVNFRRSA